MGEDELKDKLKDGSVDCWTGYPFKSLGDTYGQKAQIRKARVVCHITRHWFGVVCDGAYEEIKCGYLFKTKKACKEFEEKSQ